MAKCSRGSIYWAKTDRGEHRSAAAAAAAASSLQAAVPPPGADYCDFT